MKFNEKINRFNNSEEGIKTTISTIQKVYDLAQSDELLFKQVFGKLNTFQIFEIDVFEKQTKINLLTLDAKLKPQLISAEYLYPPVGHQIEKYLKILNSSCSIKEKRKQIRRTQIFDIILIISIVLIFIIAIYLLY